MAIPNVNCQLATAGPATAAGQVNSQGGLGGFQSRNIYLQGTAVLDGAATTFTANYIDGTQKMFQRAVVTSVLSVTAPATIGGVTNQAVYSGVGSYGVFAVGQS